MGVPYHESVARVEQALHPLLDRCQMLEFSGGTIYRGPVSAHCAAHRREAEAELRRLPGAYGFERLAGTTYLTYTLPAPHVRPVRVGLHVALLLATVATTLLVGVSLRADVGLGDVLEWVAESIEGRPGSLPVGMLLREVLVLGGPFSFAILLILGCHECGHYFMARRYGMLATPPFFLPAPVPPIGTFGAVIKIRSPMLHRRALLDVGIAGPIAGIAVALPILIYGLTQSQLVVWRYWQAGTVRFGHSALTWLLTRLVVGTPEPGYVLNWLSHPFAWAGWIGLLVTSLNLIPIGQLDGGHVAYALFGRRQRRLAWFVLGFLLALAATQWHGWLVWCILMPVLVRVAHPPVVLEEVQLNPFRRALGWLALVFLVLVFMPVPLKIVSPYGADEEADSHAASQRERQGVPQGRQRPQIPLPRAADRLGSPPIPPRPAARRAPPRPDRGDLLLHARHAPRRGQWHPVPRPRGRCLPHGAGRRPQHRQRHGWPHRRGLHQERLLA